MAPARRKTAYIHGADKAVIGLEIYRLVAIDDKIRRSAALTELYFRFCGNLGVIVFKGDLVGGIGGYFDRLPDKSLGRDKISEDKNTAKIPQPPKNRTAERFCRTSLCLYFERKGRLKAPTARKIQAAKQ